MVTGFPWRNKRWNDKSQSRDSPLKALPDQLRKLPGANDLLKQISHSSASAN